jgi:hypothetical protein
MRGEILHLHIGQAGEIAIGLFTWKEALILTIFGPGTQLGNSMLTPS